MAFKIKQDGKRMVERGYTNPSGEKKREGERGREGGGGAGGRNKSKRSQIINRCDNSSSA